MAVGAKIFQVARVVYLPNRCGWRKRANRLDVADLDKLGISAFADLWLVAHHSQRMGLKLWFADLRARPVGKAILIDFSAGRAKVGPAVEFPLAGFAMAGLFGVLRKEGIVTAGGTGLVAKLFLPDLAWLPAVERNRPFAMKADIGIAEVSCNGLGVGCGALELNQA